MTHHGPFSALDATYAALGAYVTERGIGTDGPIRENYLPDAADPDGDGVVVEVCWPVATVTRR
jgi:effector-binding domain-containing protein